MTPTAPTGMTPPAWNQRRERGSGVLVRLMIWLSLRLGWTTGQVLLHPIALYFFLFSPAARAASRAFLARVLPRPPAATDILRHIFTFACVLLDRLFLLSNNTQRFTIDAVGVADVTDALAHSRGCLLLGAHLGSFEALRCFGRQSPVPVKVLMYRNNGGAYTDLVEALDPALAQDIIEIGTPDAMLRVHESLRRGEIVGILADRAPRGEKMVTVPFLGDPAPFPAGPLQLSAALGAPVVLFFGIRTGPRRYTVQFEHFADRITLDRANRAAQTTGWVQRYAGRLEHFCRRYPFNWFNFYDFWDSRLASSTAPHSASLRDAVSPVAAGTGSERFSAAD
jgi:predicted LPLAT superfamily acyltransferase